MRRTVSSNWIRSGRSSARQTSERRCSEGVKARGEIFGVGFEERFFAWRKGFAGRVWGRLARVRKSLRYILENSSDCSVRDGE